MTLREIIKERNLSEFHPVSCKKKNMNYGEILTPKYIEIKEYLYDDESDPKLNTCVDIEGIGYGWIWNLTKLRSKFEFLQRRAIRRFVIYILDSVSQDTPIIHYEVDGIKYFGFMTDNGECYTQIRVSDKELDW